MPPSSGVASMMRSAPMRISPNCSTPSPLTSSTASKEASTLAHCAIQLGSSSKRMPDRKSTRLNSSHLVISYAVFCLKKKKKKIQHLHTVQQDRCFVVYNSRMTNARVRHYVTRY